MRILIAEHDAALGMFVMRGLEREGNFAVVVVDVASAIAAISSADYDLLLLDLDLPGGGGGMQVLETARLLGNGMRVLVVAAAAGDLETRIACLEAGADDCMAKPFAMRELKVRCRALARRQEASAVLRCGELELNRLAQSLECDREPIALSRREFALLEFLMLHRGRCVSRATLLERVWNASDATSTNVVDVYVNYLRRKLGNSGALIETVRGQGYRIAATATGKPPQSLPIPAMATFELPAYQAAALA